MTREMMELLILLIYKQAEITFRSGRDFCTLDEQKSRDKIERELLEMCDSD